MIFQLSDISIYAPALSSATNADLLAVQSIIESPLCANRVLDITEYEEIKTLHRKTQFAHVSFMPLLSDPLPLIYTRNQDAITSLGYSTNPPADWKQLTTDQYEINYKQGKIWIKQNFATHIKIVYSSGFDYTTETAEIIKQKTAFGSILEWKLSAIAQGVSSQSVPSFYSIGYSKTAQNEKANGLGQRTALNSNYEIMFDLFKQYRPRVF
jgi:hypothetical protein